MNIAQFLSKDSINLNIYLDADYDVEDITDYNKYKNVIKEDVIKTMSEILYSSGKVQNKNKLFKNLYNREKKAPTGLGQGVAIPHVRCPQAKTFIMGFCRFTSGVDFDAPDEEHVKIFIPMVAPPHNDKRYLKIYKALANCFQQSDIREELFHVEDPGEVIRILNDYMR